MQTDFRIWEGGRSRLSENPQTFPPAPQVKGLWTAKLIIFTAVNSMAMWQWLSVGGPFLCLIGTNFCIHL